MARTSTKDECERGMCYVSVIDLAHHLILSDVGVFIVLISELAQFKI